MHWLHRPGAVSAGAKTPALTAAAKTYIAAVCAAAMLALVSPLAARPSDPTAIVAFVILGGLAQILPIRFYKNASVSLSMAIALATILSFGPSYAVWVNIASGVAHYLTTVRPKHRPIYRSALTTATLVLAAWLAGQVYILTGGMIGPGSDSFWMVVPLALTTLCYYLVNTLLVTVAIALESHQSFWPLLKGNYQWLTVNIASLTPLGFGISFIYQRVGLVGVLLFILPIAIAWYSFQLYGRTIEDVRKANEDLKQANENVNRVNQELSAAHDQLRESNVELREASERVNSMYEVSRSLVGTLHVDETLNRIMAGTRLMRFPAGFVAGPLRAESPQFQYWRTTHPAYAQWELNEPDMLTPTPLRNALLGLARESWYTSGEAKAFDVAELGLPLADYAVTESERDSLSNLTLVPLWVRSEPWGLVGFGSGHPPSAVMMKELLIFRSLAESALEMAIAHDEAEREAMIDARTGLYNHRYLQEVFQHELHEASLRGSYLSFLMLDINRFKEFNDQYGHQVGDEVLTATARLLQESIRDSDIACRYGGDELCVLLRHANRASAMEVAARIDKNVNNYRFRARRELAPSASEPEELSIRVSIGVATFPDDASTRASLVEVADRASYRAKALGGGVAAEPPKLPSGVPAGKLHLVKPDASDRLSQA